MGRDVAESAGQWLEYVGKTVRLHVRVAPYPSGVEAMFLLAYWRASILEAYGESHPANEYTEILVTLLIAAVQAGMVSAYIDGDRVVMEPVDVPEGMTAAEWTLQRQDKAGCLTVMEKHRANPLVAIGLGLAEQL